MPRLKLKPLPHYSFSMALTVRLTDLNYGGHLGNDRLLALLHEARAAFLGHHGWTELDCAGASLIMGDAALVYKNEAFAGDSLSIEVAMDEPARSGFRLFYRVNRQSDGALIALAETGMATFDYQSKKLMRLPKALHLLCAGTPHPAPFPHPQTQESP